MKASLAVLAFTFSFAAFAQSVSSVDLSRPVRCEEVLKTNTGTLCKGPDAAAMRDLIQQALFVRSAVKISKAVSMTLDKNQRVEHVLIQLRSELKYSLAGSERESVMKADGETAYLLRFDHENKGNLSLKKISAQKMGSEKYNDQAPSINWSVF